MANAIDVKCAGCVGWDSFAATAHLFGLTRNNYLLTLFNIKTRLMFRFGLDLVRSIELAMPDVTEDAKYRVIELLADNPDLTQREMAQRFGLTLGKMHYSLKALAKAGFIKAERLAESDKKMGYLYVLSPTGVAERITLAARLLERKRLEFEALERELVELEKRLNQSTCA